MMDIVFVLLLNNLKMYFYVMVDIIFIIVASLNKNSVPIPKEFFILIPYRVKQALSYVHEAHAEYGQRIRPYLP